MKPYFLSGPPTLVELLEEHASRNPSQHLFTFLEDTEGEESSVTYGELDQRARMIAASLQAIAAPGERVLLLYPPGLEYIAGFFGCLYAGLVAVPAYPPDPLRLERTLPRLRAVLQDAQASVVLTTSFIQSVGESLFEQAPDLGALRWVATDGLSESAADTWLRPHVEPETLAFLQYTSGSTGMPKGVMLTHGNLMHNLGLISHAFRLRPDSSSVLWLPPYHDMGLIGGILSTLYAGMRTTLMSPLSFLKNPFRWLEALSRSRATVSGGPNFAFDLCVRKVTEEQRQLLDLSHWELAFSGAEPIRPETLDRFTHAFASRGFRREAFYPCYGLAEATLMVSGGEVSAPPILYAASAAALERHQVEDARPGQPDARLLAGCGRTLREQEILIVDPASLARCPAGRVGEIWVSGPSVARGYWRKPEETQRIFQARPSDGGERAYLRTGDLGFLKDGELFVTGRQKDIVIIRGRNHYPQDLEQTAERSHPALRPGCAAAFSLEVEGEERLVLVQEIDVRRAGDLRKQLEAGEAAAAAIRQRLAEVHEVQLHALALIEPGSIPKTSSGKIQRRAAREMFRAGELRLVLQWCETARREEQAPPAPEPAPSLRDTVEPAELGTVDGLQAWLVACVAERFQVPVASVDPSRPVTRYGLDSLAAVELAHTFEKKLGVSLSMERLLQGPSLTELARQLFALRTAAAGQSGPQLQRLPRNGPLPLSFAQQRLWFLERMEPGSARYNLPAAVRMEGPLDVAALERAFLHL
ncbi:MAG TPA: AMP-binding protein, partial [Archangium sp.]|uniref:AMP-binding protein n=1 Tax=Archangium sp. TaxID=1872627 RepID=UPI002E308E47